MVSVNQWATNGEKQDEKKCGPFQKLSGQGEQHCPESFILCLGDAEDSQRGESYSNQDVKEHTKTQDSVSPDIILYG